MRPRIGERTEEHIERLLPETPHKNKARFVEFAIQRYIDDLEERGSE